MPTPNVNRAPDTVATIVQEIFAFTARIAPHKVRGTKMFAVETKHALGMEALATRLAVATCDAWIPASTLPPPQLVSDPMHTHLLLVSVPHAEDAQIGWYIGGLVQEWRVAGSPNEQHPTHWRPLPRKP